jgi:ribosomal protein S18 acetylase RimI-like enzyme
MFWGRREFQLRPAGPADRARLIALTQSERRVHTHLDWKAAEDWLGAQPFLLAEDGGRALGALACPPDPADTAWLRLLALADGAPAEALWDRMWEAAHAELRARGARGAAAISLSGWLDAFVRRAGFEATHAVVVLSRPRGPLQIPLSGAVQVRAARPADAPAIIAVDTSAFSAPWQHSPELLAQAIARADYLSVAEQAGEIEGYQLSTPGAAGAHLARLAVRPARQGRGVGAALVADMIAHYARPGVHGLTVNTQDNNRASLALYQRLGFALTGARFPVYQRALA